MSLLGGINAVAGAAAGLQSIANTLFPNQIELKITDLTDDEITVQIDAATAISGNTSVNISEHPTENNQVFQQNVSKNARQVTLACTFSNIIRLSNAKTLTAAAQFGIAAALPEVGSLTNILLNEEDSITTRLQDLRLAENVGATIQIVGIEELVDFNFAITDISDDETTETGTSSRTVNITLREKFLANEVDSSSGIFSKALQTAEGIVGTIPAGLGF